MRKSIILAILLSLISVGILCGAYSQVNSKKEAVSVEETVIFGNKEAAKGISITSATHCDYHLFWDTSFTLGSQLEVATKFRFSQKENYDQGRQIPTANVYSISDFAASGGISALEEEMTPGVAVNPIIDVAKRTPNGKSHTEVVSLADYYSFYPLEIDIFYPNENFRQPKRGWGDVSDYFHIETPKDHKVEITVTKSREGSVTSVESRTASDAWWIFSGAVVTEKGCYIAISGANENGGQMKLPKESKGIHFLPFEEKEGELHPNKEKMKRVYSLEDEEDGSIALVQSYDKKKILMISQRADQFQFTSIDINTMKPLQEFSLPKTALDSEIGEIKVYDDFLVIMATDETFYLLETKPDGTYVEKMKGTFRLNEKTEESIPFYEMVFDYDGEKLAAAFYKERYESCDIMLMVFDRNGPAFAAAYDRSSEREAMEIERPVRPLDTTELGLSVRLK